MSLGTLMKYSIPDTIYVKIFTNISGHIKNMNEGHMGSMEEADDIHSFDMIPYELYRVH